MIKPIDHILSRFFTLLVYWFNGLYITTIKPIPVDIQSLWFNLILKLV